VTPLATRLRKLLADPRPKLKADREQWENCALLIGRRDCEAVLALLEAAKRWQTFERWKETLSEHNRSASLLDATHKLNAAIAALEESK
jgi:hypothetical protein